MTMRVRPVMGSLPTYVPGRTVPGAVKLASNENGYPPLPHVADRIAVAATQMNRYPDINAVELTNAIAARYGVAAEQAVVGCGSVALCQQLVSAVVDPGEDVVFAWRSFEAYPIVTAIAGANAVTVPLAADVHDLDAMAKAITDKTRLVFVCTPNNPTGTALTTAAVTRFLDQVPADVVVVLDEAYREFVTDPDMVDGLTLLSRYPNLVVLRTFSKAYGLAGLRVGYGIAVDPELITAVRKTQVPFAVTQIGQVAALASLEPAAEVQLTDRVASIVAERDRVTAALRGAGLYVPQSEANFVWLGEGTEPGRIDSVAFGQACERHGVIVRVFAGWGARITISTPEENERFLAAALSFVA